MNTRSLDIVLLRDLLARYHLGLCLGRDAFKEQKHREAEMDRVLPVIQQLEHLIADAHSEEPTP